jgi:hypothetical protein
MTKILSYRKKQRTNHGFALEQRSDTGLFLTLAVVQPNLNLLARSYVHVSRRPKAKQIIEFLTTFDQTTSIDNLSSSKWNSQDHWALGRPNRSVV